MDSLPPNIQEGLRKSFNRICKAIDSYFVQLIKNNCDNDADDDGDDGDDDEHDDNAVSI